MITAAAELDLPDEPPLPALTIRSPTQLGTLTAERKRLLEAAVEEAEGKKATWAEEIKLERAAPRCSSKAKSAPRQPRGSHAMPTIEQLPETRIEVLFECQFDIEVDDAPAAKGKGKGKKKK